MSMASHHLGAETSAQTHRCHSQNGLQGGLLRTPDHPAPQRACPCKVCWRLQQASSSPSCSKTPTSEINREYPYLQRQGLGFCTSEGANFNEEFRYGFRPSHWPAPAPDRFPAPCHHSNPLYVPRTPQSPYVPQTPQSDAMAMGAASAHGNTPAASRFSPLRFNQGRDWEQKDRRMEPNSKGSGSYGGLPNEVILYSWFLIRYSGSSKGVEVSVGGFLTLGTAGTERFETGAIVQRLEKCRLVANDGLEVRLAGLIDDCTTVSNGFSLDIVQAFLSGFPYTWNHLLNNEFRAPTPRHPDHQVSGSCGFDGGVETSQLSFEGSDQENRAPSPRQKGVPCDHPEKTNIIELNVKQTMTAEAQAEKEAASDKQEQKSQLSPRITRSMQKISRQAATSHNECHNISNGADTSAHGDSLNNCEVHTPAEQCGRHVKSRSGSTVFQERTDKAYHRRSRRTLSGDSNRDNIDGGKSSNMSPCSYTEGVVEMGVQGPENPMNVEASPAAKGEAHSINQEAFFAEAVQANDNGITDEEGNIIPSVQKSKEPVSFESAENPRNVEASPAAKGEGHSINQEAFVADDNGITDEEGNIVPSVQKSKEPVSFESVEKLTKASQNERSKREGDLLSKSPGQGSKRLDIPPPLPRRRVPVSQRLISAAFGLKTSRSGRLLVPPLAHWRSQGLVRDKDGGIIAISDGSKDMSNVDTGYFKFKPPAEAGLKKLQKRLREVATDCTPSKKRLGTRKRR